MALTYGFYNSIEGDRVYDAIQFGRIFDGIIKDGVYATYEKGMMVIASSNPGEVIIQPGRAWFNHTWSYNDANVIFEAPAPEVLLERYDALVLEINEELSSRENSFKWVQGTPSSRPERPVLTNTSTIHQYPLCYVHRYPETTMIYARDITNTIGTSECPFATGVLEGIDLDAWINQWDDEFHNWESTTKTGFETWMLNQEQVYTTWFNSMHSQMDTDLAEFEAWFQTIQGIIDEEAALHLQQEIDELRQEATSGSRIFVHTINQSLFGKNVTITEAGGTVFTSRFDNTGVAEFKSVPYVGNLTISSTDGIQTATSVVNTPYYARYNFTIAFWAATVNIVGDPEMSGSTVTVRDSNEILVGTVVLDSEGAGIFTATAPDTYKFILTYGGETMEVTLSVTQETTYTVDLHAAGFKWEDWLEAGGVTGSYSSLDDVLADEVALRRLFTVHASVDYMADINDENEDVEKIIGTDLAAKWINLRDYALDTLYANEIIAGYMDAADKYFYGEWALMPQVPTMTEYNTPYGLVNASSFYDSSTQPYYAFDGNDSTYWAPTSGSSNNFIRYTFVSPVKPSKAKVSIFMGPVSGHTMPARTLKIQGSNDGFVSDIHELGTINIEAHPSQANEIYDVTLVNENEFSSLRLFCSDALYTSGQWILAIRSLQFYAWAPKGNVPVMTSNTAPYGTASASSAYSGSSAYYAFDGNYSTMWEDNVEASGRTARVVYHFTNPICPKKVSFTIESQNLKVIADNYVIVGSNDGTNYTPLLTIPSANISKNEEYVANIENDTYYMYLGMQYLKKTNSTPNVRSLQFYGRELSAYVPVMTSNTTPYGEASASSVYGGGMTAYRAFDGNASTYALSETGVTENTIDYHFVNPVVIKRADITCAQKSNPIKDFTIEGSNDGTNYTVLGTFTNQNPSTPTAYLLNNAEAYHYYRLNVTAINRTDSTNAYVAIYELQFYGLDYSEKEFEEGTTKKWLYDHGVELVTFTYDGADGASGITTNDGEAIFINNPTNELMGGVYYQLDVTDFNLYRAKVGDITTTSRNIYGSYAIGVDATTPTYTHANMDARYSFYSNTAPCPLAPNNIGFDISAINGVVYVIASGGETPARSGYVKNKFTELWLE